ncbi:MAG: HAMP domain-containing sensor histidine kinase [Patescibacteria group bacterium]
MSTQKLLSAVTYIKQHPQVLFALMLLFVIPLLFLYTGQKFLEVGTYNQDRLQKDKVGIMHDALVSLSVATNVDLGIIETQMQSLAEQNPDIIDVKLLQATPQGIISLVARDSKNLGEIEENVEPFSSARLFNSESIIFESMESGSRFWYGYRAFTSAEGSEFFIYTKSSLAAVDQLFADREFAAYWHLFFIYIFLLLLAIWHIKLTDYRYLYTEARQAIETKDLFTHMIAHELRAPLTAIRGYASMLKEHVVEDTYKEQASRIEVSSERLITIVSDLLDIARLQSGKLEIHPETIDVHTVVRDVVAEFTPVATQKQCQLVWDDTNTSQTIFADPKRTHQILTNIISNSIKYTDKGVVTIATHKEHSYVEVRVKDTGAGISAEDQKKLFAPFFRTKDAESSATTGTGLGMWITKELIELMGGTIGVESIQGVGTQIVMTFPIQPPKTK